MRSVLPSRRNLAASIVLAFVLAGALTGLAASTIPLSVMTRAMGAMSGAGDASGTIAERYAGLVFRAG